MGLGEREYGCGRGVGVSPGCGLPDAHAGEGWLMARALASVRLPAILREWFSAWPRPMDLDGGHSVGCDGINACFRTRTGRDCRRETLKHSTVLLRQCTAAEPLPPL